MASCIRFLLWCFPALVFSQERLGFDNLYLNIGTTVNLYYWGGTNFPGIKAFVGVGGIKQIDSKYGNYMMSVGMNIGIYNKSLGNSLILLKQDNQIDFTSSLFFGPASSHINEKFPLYKNLRTINNLPFYNLRFGNEGLAMLGVNFIMNNHVRHQTVGAIVINYKNVSINYYNDGGMPLNLLGLGDSFDRWWTGGGGIYYHSIRKNNLFELTFDQFTGYERQYFELASRLGMDVQDYSIFSDIKPDTIGTRYNVTGFRSGNNYNSSSYSLRCFINESLAINVGVIGSLRGTNKEGERLWGVQDLIHNAMKIAIHPNFDANRILVGLTFNHFNPIK